MEDDAHNLMPIDLAQDIPPLDATAEESDPMAWVKYDRLFQRECPADGTCYGDRHHLEFGLGMTFGR